MKMMYTKYTQEKEFLGIPVTLTTAGTIESEDDFEDAVRIFTEHFLKGKISSFTVSWDPLDEDEDEDEDREEW